MKNLEYSRICRNAIENIAKISPGDQVLIVTDPIKQHIAQAFAAETRALDANTNVLIKPRLKSHSNELSEMTAAAMLNADYVIGITEHSITHTTARRDATAAGVKFMLARGITEDILIEQATTDYEAIDEVTRAVAAIQTAASKAYVTTPSGTDVEVDVEGRNGFTVEADIEKEVASLLPGKSAISPNEGTAQGTIVIDYSIDGIGTLDEPVELTVEDGLVTDFSGGRQADELASIVEEAGESARNIAEAPSIGTNPNIKLTGNQATDKKKRGTMHFAIGDNVTLGGTNHADIHFDMTVADHPTVTFDDLTILEDGTFKKDLVLDAAAGLAD